MTDHEKRWSVPPSICIGGAAYRSPATAVAGIAASIRVKSLGDKEIESAPRDSASCDGVRASTTGTMLSPLAQHAGDGQLRGAHSLFGGQIRQPCHQLPVAGQIIGGVKRGK